MGVRAIMDKYSLEYEDLDIINNQEIYAEMVEKSAQPFLLALKLMGLCLLMSVVKKLKTTCLATNL